MAALSLHSPFCSSNSSTLHNSLLLLLPNASTGSSAQKLDRRHWGDTAILSLMHAPDVFLFQRSHENTCFAPFTIVPAFERDWLVSRGPFHLEEAVGPGIRRKIIVRSDGQSIPDCTGRPDRNPKVIRWVKNLSENSTTPEVLDVCSKEDLDPHTGAGGGDSGGDSNGKFGSGGGDDGDADQNDPEEDEFGPLLNADEVNRKVSEKGVVLPSDMLEAANTVGVRSLLLSRYMDLQGAAWPLGAAIQGSRELRNRMLADESFLFKVFAEIVIDSSCATFAEMQKRGKDFWNEFELFMADLLVGVVLDVALVGMLAPFVQFGSTTPTFGRIARLSQAVHALPSSVFEAGSPGRRFSLQQRVATYFFKAVQYGSAGFVCGIIGQGIANAIMIMKRKLKQSEEQDIPVPPLVQSAALWGVFLAISSNTRYQIINGLERVVEGSPIAKRVPPFAMVFTIGIRFANNIYGAMQFVDWARWAGVQ